MTDLRACPTGVHPEHDGLTCHDADTIRSAEPSALAAAVDRAIHALDRTPRADMPPALRGPNWKGRP